MLEGHLLHPPMMIEICPFAEHLVINMTRIRPTGTSWPPTGPPLLGPCPFSRGPGGKGRKRVDVCSLLGVSEIYYLYI